MICAELYADCVTPRWHRLLSPAEARARDDFFPFGDFPQGLFEQGRRWGAAFELGDDHGTRYERVAGDSAMTHEYSRRRDDKPTPVWGYATFRPHVPQDATTWKPSTAPTASRSHSPTHSPAREPSSSLL